MTEIPFGAFLRGRHWREWEEQLRQVKLTAGAGVRLRESDAGTVIEAADRSAAAPEPIPAPFEIYPDSGAGVIGVGAGAILHSHGQHADIRPIGAAQGALPASSGRYLLTLLFQSDWAPWTTYVWLPSIGGVHSVELRPGLHPIPIAAVQIARRNGVSQVTDVMPYCRSLPVIEVPEFPFRATMWAAAPAAFSVVSDTGPAPTRLIIERGIAPTVSRFNWPAENTWVPVPQMVYTIGDVDSLDGLYFLRLKGSDAGIRVAQCSLTTLAANGGKAWDDTNGWAHLPICRVVGLTITQYAGYSQYAVPLYDPES